MFHQKDDLLNGVKGPIVLGLLLKVDKTAVDHHTNARKAEILMVVSMMIVTLTPVRPPKGRAIALEVLIE